MEMQYFELLNKSNVDVLMYSCARDKKILAIIIPRISFGTGYNKHPVPSKSMLETYQQAMYLSKYFQKFHQDRPLEWMIAR